MALRDLQTNLKSLRYGKDTVGGGSSNEPYVTTSINTAPGDTGGTDFTLRANTLTRVGRDEKRLGKFFASSKGAQFTAKQNLLSRTGVKTQASGVINEGTYIPTSTLAQIAGNPFGTHLNKQGVNPFRNTNPNQAKATNLFDRIVNFDTPLGLPVYTSIVDKKQEKEDNRLVNLKNDKIGSPIPLERNQGFLSNLLGDTLGNILNSINPFKNKIEDITTRLFSNTKGKSAFKGEILRYGGGPGSALGVGQTVIKRYSDTTAYNTPEFEKKYYLLNAGQISSYESSKDNTIVNDFRTNVLGLQRSGTKKNILSTSLDYSRPENRIEQRVNLGNPGRRDKNVSSYSKGLGEPLDKINAYPLYKDTNSTTDSIVNDLVKFRIGVIDNKNPNEKTYIHFRAFIDNFSDNYSAEWNAEQYMGRGEKFYRYGGFDRAINLDWTIAAQSKEEIMVQYQKLNYLASSLAPDYTDAGYMAGNLVTLTLGGWCYEQPGFITNLNLSVPQESPWEINISDGSGINPNLKEMPHMVKVTGFNFTPIHNFVPRVQQNTLNTDGTKGYGKQRYIALEDKNGSAYERPKTEAILDKLGSTLIPKGVVNIQAPIPKPTIDLTQGITSG
jgi:hypothetical protein